MKALITAIVLLPCTLLAQGTSPGLSYLLLPVHARTGALGGAVVASQGEFSSSLANPASLHTQGGPELMLSHSEWIQDVRSEFIGTRIPVSIGTLGLGITNVNVQGIELRQRPGPADGSFTARFAAIHLSFARTFGSDLTFGITAKYLYEKLFVDEANGYSIDAGILYKSPIPELSIGLALTNTGTMSAFRQVRAKLPQQIQVGASYKLTQGDLEILPSLTGVVRTSADTRVAAGVETWYQKSIALRLGYDLSGHIRSVSMGAGIRYEFLTFDYAFVPFSLDFGNAHLFSLGFEF